MLTDQCVSCPYGGFCPAGSIIARPHFWGYQVGQNVEFVSCPIGYCCDVVSTACSVLDTCAQHRQGRLCGGCKAGYTETLITTKCVPDSQCDDDWLWTVFAVSAFVYIIWYSYKGEIVGIIYGLPRLTFRAVVQCVWKLIVRNTDGDPTSNHQSEESNGEKPSLKNNTAVNAEEMVRESPDSQRGDDESNIGQSNECEAVDKAYFSIIVYFVNIMSILTIKVELSTGLNEAESLIYEIFMKYVMRFINLDVYRLPFNACPYSGIHPAFKAVLKPLFVVFIYAAWLILFSFASILQTCLKSRASAHEKIINTRQNLLAGLVETIKYGYSGFAGATFFLLTCVSINGTYFWFYDANHECLDTFQYYVIAFGIIFTLPFSLSLIIGMELLKLGRISSAFFLLSCILPLPCVFAWLFLYLLKWKKKAREDVIITVYSKTILSSL